MADYVMELFANLFSGVIDWFTGNLGDLFGNLINMFLEALIGGAQQTLEDIVHGLLSGLVNEVIEGVEAVAWIPEWVKYGLTTFAGNVGEALGTIASGAITLASEGSMEILGVTNAQEQYMTELQTSLTVAMGALMDRIEYSQTWNAAVGEETVTTFIGTLDRTVNAAFSEATAYLQSTQIGVEGQMRGAQTYALELLGSTLLGVQYAGRVAIEMIGQDVAGVNTYLTEVAVGGAERYFETLRETIFRPAATAQALQWALSNLEPATREELKDAVIDYLIVQHEVQLELAERNLIVPPPR